jgi:hypothetical protein
MKVAAELPRFGRQGHISVIEYGDAVVSTLPPFSMGLVDDVVGENNQNN